MDKHRTLRRTLLAAAIAVGGTGATYHVHAQPAPEAPQPAEQPQPGTAPAPSDTGAAPAPAPSTSAPAAGQPTATPPAPPAPAAPAPPAAPAAAAPAADASQSADSNLDVDLSGLSGEEPYEGTDEVIVVTGSAIERKGLTTAAPVAIIGKTDLDASGLVSVGDILQNLPSQSNAINVQFNNGGDGSTRVNLRGLGTNRTLVLVNGRRHVAGGTGANSSVDLNAIPLAVIERVEVLKDGASAIYGSDAVGGVVNIITRRNMEGSEATGYIGTTGDGLGTVTDVSVATGVNSKRGNIVFSAGYYEQRAINAGERDFSRCDRDYDWEAEDGTPEADRITCTGSATTPNGLIFDNPGTTQPGNDAWNEIVSNNEGPFYGYDPVNDTWRDFNFDGSSDVGAGDLYNFQPDNYLVTPQQRYNMFSTGSYKLTDNVEAFFEASYTNRQSDQKLAPEPLATSSEGIVVAADNYYNPFGRSFTNVNRRFVEGGERRSIQNIDTFRIVGGIDGKLPKELNNWRWGLAYNFGTTESTDVNEGNFVRDRLTQALGPSFVDADGNIRCGTAANPGDPDCVPLDLFHGPGSITQEMLDWVSYTGTTKGLNKQRSVNFNTTGRLFSTPWGGDVALAFGGEYRNELGAYLPDALIASGNTTGNKSDPTEGSFTAYEGYSELSVVPVTGKKFAEWVELNAAVRGFHYNTFGFDTTWKTGGLWRFGQGASVRGTYSTAFRAPSIGELFSGQADSFPRVTDPCDTLMGERTEIENQNCMAYGVPDNHTDERTQINTLVGGNPNLKPETAKIFTVGAVYEPKPIPGLALTVDYFNIQVDDSIQPRGATVIMAECYGRPTDEAKRAECAELVIRDSTGRITRIIDTESNIGGAETAGVDFNVRYELRNPQIGRLRFNLEGTWLHKYNEILPDETVVKGKGVYDLGVFPDWKFNFSTLWGLKNFGAGLNARFINGFIECENNDCSEKFDEETGEPVENPTRSVSSDLTADIFGTYNIKTPAGKTMLTAGINNILDKEPTRIYNGFLANSDAATYDYLGRYFYLRLVQQF